MVKLEKISIPNYTLGEELVNAISHGIGALLSIAGLVLLSVKSSTVIATVSSVLYGSIMIVLFTISCVYHALSPRLKGKKVLRVIDHCNVLMMVAGTYLPIALSLFGGALGWGLFGFVWALTIPVVVLTAVNVDKFSVLSVIDNLILGWGILLLIGPLRSVCPLEGIWLLVGGGIAYTVGSVLYGLGAKKKWFHSIFHFFVLLGALLHFFFIYFYCI